MTNPRPGTNTPAEPQPQPEPEPEPEPDPTPVPPQPTPPQPPPTDPPKEPITLHDATNASTVSEAQVAGMVRASYGAYLEHAIEEGLRQCLRASAAALGRLSVYLLPLAFCGGDSGNMCAENSESDPAAGTPDVSGTAGDPNQHDPNNRKQPDVQFGGNDNQIYHAFRHVDQLGLDRAAVQSAIRQDLLGRSLQVGEFYSGTVEVGGFRLQYNAYQLSEELINVGRINKL